MAASTPRTRHSKPRTPSFGEALKEFLLRLPLWALERPPTYAMPPEFPIHMVLGPGTLDRPPTVHPDVGLLLRQREL